jgi:hypothetical protein
VNRSPETTAQSNSNSDRIARAAWFCAFVLPLALAAMLLGVKSAQAAPASPGVVPLAFEEELFEGEEELGSEGEVEFAEEECEIAEEEAAEGVISDAEAKTICEEAEEAIAEVEAGPSSTARNSCTIRSAHVHAVVRRNKLKVTVGYTSSRSTPATIQVRSGTKNLVSLHRHLGRAGVLRISKRLGSKPVKRVSVSFKTPSCGKLVTKSVKVR